MKIAKLGMESVISVLAVECAFVIAMRWICRGCDGEVHSAKTLLWQRPGEVRRSLEWRREVMTVRDGYSIRGWSAKKLW